MHDQTLTLPCPQVQTAMQLYPSPKTNISRTTARGKSFHPAENMYIPRPDLPALPTHTANERQQSPSRFPLVWLRPQPAAPQAHNLPATLRILTCHRARLTRLPPDPPTHLLCLKLPLSIRTRTPLNNPATTRLPEPPTGTARRPKAQRFYQPTRPPTFPPKQPSKN